jgi:hypothetical protein
MQPSTANTPPGDIAMVLWHLLGCDVAPGRYRKQFYSERSFTSRFLVIEEKS